MASFTEENYLKAIFHLEENGSGETVSTNALAEITQTKAASVTDMLRRLAEKDFIHYKKYQGVRLTVAGKNIALQIIRKHRLWEVFLVEKLGFGWDEIHEIAEELEHIESKILTERLANFLGNPEFDPHGDPIPNEKGEIPTVKTIKLSEAPFNQEIRIWGVAEDSSVFLQHLTRLDLHIGSSLIVRQKSEFDQSISISINQKNEVNISAEVAKNLWVVVK